MPSADRQSATGRVVLVAANHVVVNVDPENFCARCAAGKGCGAGVFGRRGPKQVEARIGTRNRPAVGDRVVLTVSPADLLNAALLAYGLPLLGALVFAAAVWLLDQGDLIAALAAVAGAGAGVAVARFWLRRQAAPQAFVPVASVLLDAVPESQ